MVINDDSNQFSRKETVVSNNLDCGLRVVESIVVKSCKISEETA